MSLAKSVICDTYVLFLDVLSESILHSQKPFFLCLLKIYTFLIGSSYFFSSIDRDMFKTWLARGLIPDFADWTGFRTKY